MFEDYLKSQQRDMLKLIAIVMMVISPIIYLLGSTLLSAIILGFIVALVANFTFIFFSFSAIHRGMRKYKVAYAVTKMGSFSGNSRIYFCKKVGKRLVSINSEFPFELTLSSNIFQKIDRQHYFYKKEGRTTFFVFKSDASADKSNE